VRASCRPEKEYNKHQSAEDSDRTCHAICRIKKHRIMNDVFRIKLRKCDKISVIVCGLINYRIMNIG
jgi:hypothetical protein